MVTISKCFQAILSLRDRIKESLINRKRETLRYIEYKRLKRIRKKSVPPYEYCKNCGEKLTGIYCSKCGQYAHDVNQTFRLYIKQFLENTFQFDGKIFQTLRFLIFSPGFLSREFMHGKINSYVLPLKMYMFMSVVFFGFVLLVFDTGDEINRFDFPKGNENISMNIGIKDDKAATITQQIKPLKEQFTKQEWQRIYHEAFILVTKYSPFILLLMIPLYAWMMKRAYSKRMPNYTHNLVFAFHIHTFFLLLLSIGVLCGYYLKYNCGLWLLLFFVIYHIIAVHTMYTSSWVSSIYKTVVNLMLYSFFLILIATVLSIYIIYQIAITLDVKPQ